MYKGHLGYNCTVPESFSCRVKSNGLGRHKSFTHIEHRGGAVGREGLVNSIPVLTSKYLLPSQ